MHHKVQNIVYYFREVSTVEAEKFQAGLFLLKSTLKKNIKDAVAEIFRPLFSVKRANIGDTGLSPRRHHKATLLSDSNSLLHQLQAFIHEEFIFFRGKGK